MDIDIATLAGVNPLTLALLSILSLSITLAYLVKRRRDSLRPPRIPDTSIPPAFPKERPTGDRRKRKRSRP